MDGNCSTLNLSLEFPGAWFQDPPQRPKSTDAQVPHSALCIHGSASLVQPKANSKHTIGFKVCWVQRWESQGYRGPAAFTLFLRQFERPAYLSPSSIFYSHHTNTTTISNANITANTTIAITFISTKTTANAPSVTTHTRNASPAGPTLGLWVAEGGLDPILELCSEPLCVFSLLPSSLRISHSARVMPVFITHCCEFLLTTF